MKSTPNIIGGRDMKANFLFKFLIALLLSACSSTFFASAQNDDLYYVPGKKKDVSKQEVQKETPVPTKTDKKNDQGLTDYEKYRRSLEEGDTSVINEDAGVAADEQEPNVESEEYYGDGDNNTYIYNNYYYASRLNRFHGGYYSFYDSWYDPWYSTWYDPWYDPWYYSPGWSFSVGWGWGWPYYSNWGWGYHGYDRYYGGSWGYYGYMPYRSSHYNGWYNHGYYYPGSYSSERYGRIGNRSSATSGTYGIRTRNSGTVSTSRGTYTTRGSNAGGIYTSPSGRRYGTGSTSTSTERNVYTRRAPSENGGGSVSPNGRRYGGSSQNVDRSGSSERYYTPSYSKPRTYSRPSYNDNSGSSQGAASSYSRPRRSSEESSSSGSSGSYSRPSNNGSNSGYSGRSYTPSSRGSSGSSSSGSYSTGRSYGGGGGSSSSSSGSSSGSSSSGGGGGSRRR